MSSTGSRSNEGVTTGRTAEDWQQLVASSGQVVRAHAGRDALPDPRQQLDLAVQARLHVLHGDRGRGPRGRPGGAHDRRGSA